VAYLKARNLEKYQHYDPRLRGLVWIKLYIDLLSGDDRNYAKLSDVAKLHLHHLWLLAAKLDSEAGETGSHQIEYDLDYLQRRLNLSEPLCIDELIDAGFIEKFDAEGEEEKPKRSRKPVKGAVAGVPVDLVSAAELWNTFGSPKVSEMTVKALVKQYQTLAREMKKQYESWTLTDAVRLVEKSPSLQGETWMRFREFFFSHNYLQKNERLWTGYYGFMDKKGGKKNAGAKNRFDRYAEK
jgi:hypothetical protein